MISLIQLFLISLLPYTPAYLNFDEPLIQPRVVSTPSPKVIPKPKATVHPTPQPTEKPCEIVEIIGGGGARGLGNDGIIEAYICADGREIKLPPSDQ